jgi:hypothetical protein
MQANEQYLEKVEKAYLESVSMMEDMSSWEVYENCEELAAYTRRSPSGLDILKIEFFINRNPEQVLNFIFKNLGDLHNRLNRDLVSEHGIAVSFGEDSRIRYEVIDAHVPGVSPREIVYFGIKMQVSEDVFALIETSVDAPERPQNDNWIRAEIIYALHLCEKINNQCHVVSIGYADPKGSIPKTIVNMGVRKRVDFYKVLIKEILNETN